MHNGVRAWAVALGVAATLTGCGGGGGGSSPGGPSPVTPTAATTTSSNPTVTPTTTAPTTISTPTTTTPTTTLTTTTPTTSVRQTLAGKSLVLKAARGVPTGHARPLARRGGRVVDVTADVIEEVLVFGSDGSPDLTQSRVADLTNPAGAVVTAATVGDGGALSETVQFAGAAETDTITGTLLPAADGLTATLQNGADSLVVGGAAPVVLSLPLAGAAEGGSAAVDPAAFGAAPGGTYTGTVTALDGSGAALTGPVLSLTVNPDGSFQGSLDYTDGGGNLRTQIVFGQLDAGGDSFGTLTGDGSQTFGEQISVAAASGVSGALTVTGLVLDGTGAVTVSYAGTLSPAPPSGSTPTPSRRRR